MDLNALSPLGDVLVVVTRVLRLTEPASKRERIDLA
jgi:hypothetical protein